MQNYNHVQQVEQMQILLNYLHQITFYVHHFQWISIFLDDIQEDVFHSLQYIYEFYMIKVSGKDLTKSKRYLNLDIMCQRYVKRIKIMSGERSVFSKYKIYSLQFEFLTLDDQMENHENLILYKFL